MCGCRRSWSGWLFELHCCHCLVLLAMASLVTYTSGMTLSHCTRHARVVRALVIATTALTTAGLAGCGGHSVGAGHSQAKPAALVSAQSRPHYEEDDPQWNCQLDGDRQCGHVPACWTEHKVLLPDERLCGFADGAAPLSDGWVFGDYYHDSRIR
jgi:hypothetical protein